MIDRLRNLLGQIGPPASPLELAELIWLAGHLPSDGTAGQAAKTAIRKTKATLSEPGVSDPGAMYASTEQARRGERGQPLYTTGAAAAEGTASASVLVPTAPMLSDPLSIQRSLRPLKRMVPTRVGQVLDESATAETIAERIRERPWIPVLAPTRERWLSLALVIDIGLAMDALRPLADELHEAMIGLGAFRDVRMWFVADAGDKLGIRASPRGPVQAPAALVDSAGRQAVALISDCSGPHWWDGRMAPVVHALATRGVAVIMQPLAERLWRRTAAPTVSGRAILGRPGAPNTEIRFTPHHPERHRPRGTAIPVVELSPGWLADWAKLVTASGGPRDTAMAYLASGTQRSPDSPVAAERDLPIPDRVSRFVAAASPSAVRLAGHVAVSVPAIPVMQLIQQRLRGSRPADLAEVLLSGLLAPVDAAPGLYEFLPGVRAALLELLPRQESLATANTLERVSGEIQDRAGTAARRFRAMMPVPGGTGTGAIGADQRPFALVSEEAASILSRHALPAPNRQSAEDPTQNIEGTASDSRTAFRNGTTEKTAQSTSSWAAPTLRDAERGLDRGSVGMNDEPTAGAVLPVKTSSYRDSFGKTLADYPRPSFAVDVVLLTVMPDADRLSVLQVRRADATDADPARWGLPGTFLHEGEVLIDAVQRCLRGKAGVEGTRPRQLHVFDKPDRDDRGWVLSAAHMDVVRPERLGGRIEARTRIVPADDPGILPSDHIEIIQRAVATVRSSYELGPDPERLIPEPFTILELRLLHEAVVGRKFQRDSFRRLMEPQLTGTGMATPGTRGRPAELFRHKH